MEVVASTAKLVDPAGFDAEGGLSATLPRSEIETALQDDAGADLLLEIARIQNGERDDRKVKVAWERADLENLLQSAVGDPITLTFSEAEVQRMLDADFEAHGLREKALVLTVAAATAAGMAGSAAAYVASDGGGGGTSAPAASAFVTDASTAGVPGSVSSFTTDASTAGVDSSVPADGWMSGVESPVPDSAGVNLVTDNSTGGVPGAVSGFATDASTSGTDPVAAPTGGVSGLVTDNSGGQPGAVSGFATDASTSGQPDAIPGGFITDTGSEATRSPAQPVVGGGGGFTVPDAAVDAALAAGLAMLITGAAFVGRTRRHGAQPA
jgi:hypothetical protein